MSGLDRDRLADNLAKIKEAYCAYGAPPGGLCDCKFMPEDGRVKFQSECYCGCPEITQALALIRAMSKRDFARLAKKAKLRG